MVRGEPLGSDRTDGDNVPGYKNYVVYTDETGMHNARYYAFGSLWMPWERRGAFQQEFRSLQDKHGLPDELKWKKQTKRTEHLARDLIEFFFKRTWMMFHCILVNRDDVDGSKHRDSDEAEAKHLTMLLRNKVKYFATGGGKLYRVRVDPLPWRYERADERMHKIVNAQLTQDLGLPLVHDVIACESKTTLGIQLADLLLGAVAAAWQRQAEAQHKMRLMSWIADHLGWPDLRHDTNKREWKFNVWYFHDPQRGSDRAAKTLPVKLAYPMPAYRPGQRTR